MSLWPDTLNTVPIREWPGPLTPDRRIAPFSATLTTTLEDLGVELRALAADDVELQIALEPGQFRNDGNPRAGVTPAHPGVILTFTTKLGAQSYPCDTFTRWEANLRAITLSLEALRKVDRYGVTKHGEQYRGFMAIEAPTAMPAGFTSPAQAWDFIRLIGGYERDETPTKRLIRDALRRTHPDQGGNPADFQRVTLAEQYLKQNGHLS